jgi:hypothetical protein
MMRIFELLLLMNPCKPIVRELVRQFGRRVSFLSPALKDQRQMILEDLIKCILQYFDTTEVWRYWGEDLIEHGKSHLELQSIPVAELNCTAISNCLGTRLTTNVDLDAARNVNEISDSDWKDIADVAASEILKRFLQTALRMLIEREQIFKIQGSSNQYMLLAIEEKEAYIINGISTYADMLKIYDAGGAEAVPPRKARKLWLRRYDKRSFYKRGHYTNSSFMVA